MNYSDEEIDTKIKLCLDMVGNIHPILYEKLFNDLHVYDEKTNIIKLKCIVNKLLQIPEQGRHTFNYWFARGWSETESYFKAKEEAKTRKPRHSPFSKEFWMEKINPNTGEKYTESEADFHRNILRPIKKEYWMVKGYSEEESIQLASKTKNDNNKKGSIKISEKSPEFRKSTNKLSVDYWLLRGYTEEEAKEIKSERQNTFTLEKCKERYGEDEGYKVWKKRQDKWQNTLKSKSEEDLADINARKRSILMKNTVLETIEHYNKVRNMSLVSTMEEYIKIVEQDIINKPHKKYWLVEKYVNQISKIQLEILELEKSEIIKHIEHLFENKIFKNKRGLKKAYCKWTKLGMLRSSFEIYFYDKFTDKFPDVHLKIDKPYPNSLLRYDFFIDDKYYVEICPGYTKDKNYALKIDKKKELFDCVLLKTIEDIDTFIENYKLLLE